MVYVSSASYFQRHATLVSTCLLPRRMTKSLSWSTLKGKNSLLKDKILSSKSLTPIEEGGINENDRVASPETPYTLALTLKAPITTAAEDISKYFFIVFQRK